MQKIIFKILNSKSFKPATPRVQKFFNSLESHCERGEAEARQSTSRQNQQRLPRSFHALAMTKNFASLATRARFSQTPVKARKSKSLSAKIAIAVTLSFCVSGCAKHEKNAVYIPTKCAINLPQKPYPRESQTTAQKVGEILIYAEQLEADLKFCTGRE